MNRTSLVAIAAVFFTATQGRSAPPAPAQVPGVVVDHLPAASGVYVGSPSLAVLPSGQYVAAHDHFGPKSTEHERALTSVFRSEDRGRTWKKVSAVQGAFWSALFVHRGALYLIGPDRHHGNILIRRSADAGATWTAPTNSTNGVLRDNGEYHCAPMPVIEHSGRLWRAFEWRNPPLAWGINYRAGMLSAPVDADLLSAASWTASNFVPSDRAWNGHDMGAWLEGNAVVAPDGQVVDVLRVQTQSLDEKAAIVRISADGKTASFDPAKGFVDFPGGAKKFAIRFDPPSKLYWSLANIVHPRHRKGSPGGIRNTLALTCSPDLAHWTVRSIVLYHPDVKKHAFQYVDWLFDGQDMLVLSRTAYDDGQGGAHNAHDANYLTFHRVANFRRLTLADSAPQPAAMQIRRVAPGFTIVGTGFEMVRFDEGGAAFSNRNYVWKNLPRAVRGWQYTQTAGGEAAEITLEATRDVVVGLVGSPGLADGALRDWIVTDDEFHYSDKGKTRMALFARKLKSGAKVVVPQDTWTGTLVLVPPEGVSLPEPTPIPNLLERVKYNHPGLAVDLGVGLWAFPSPIDFNGDGRFDLAVSCPDKPYNGLYFFENPGVDTAQNPCPVFKPGRRVSKGLQMAQASYVDGKPRVLTPAAEYPDFLKSGLDKPVKLPLPSNVHPNKVRGNIWRYVDFDGDGRLDLVVGVDDWTDYGWDDAYDKQGRWQRGPLRGFVYVIRNAGTNAQPVYEKPTLLMAGGKPVETFGWPSPCFADFDGDGDLDLICGEFVDGFTYFENVGTRTAPKYAPGRRLKTAQGQPLVMDLEMITPVAFDWNRDGHIDLIVGDEDGRVALIQHSGKLSADHTPQFLAPKYFQQEADELKCGALATPVGCDWDGDGDIDIISGNSAGYIEYFENLSGPGAERPKWAAPRRLEADGKVIRFMAGPNGSIQGPCEAKWGYTTLSVADWDGDGLPDLIVNSIWGKVVWFRNVGTRRAPKLAAAQPIEVAWDGPPPTLSYGWLRPKGNELLTQWRTTPVAVDWDGDGLTDLVMLDHEGYLAFYQRAKRAGQLVLLPPQRVFCDEKGNPLRLNANSGGRSGRRKLCVVDWDGDGKLDLLLNSRNANFLRQVAHRDGKWFFKDTGPLVKQNIEGHDVSPTTVNWRHDGIPDFLGGAEDGRFYLLPNPRRKAGG